VGDLKAIVSRLMGQEHRDKGQGTRDNKGKGKKGKREKGKKGKREIGK
jgi:hypothetical protein